MMLRILLSLGFFLLALPAAAMAGEKPTLAAQLEALNARRVIHCQYYTTDSICGAGDSAELKTENQRSARNAWDRAINQLVSDVLDQSVYMASLEEINRLYSGSTPEMQTTIQIVSVQLNLAWLQRYQPEVEIWLSSLTADRSNGLALGWTMYAVAFAAHPKLSAVPVLHQLLRSRLPWAALAAGTVVAATAITDHFAESSRPEVPPPPYHFLNLGLIEDPGADTEAQMNYAETAKFREIFGVSAGVFTTLVSNSANLFSGGLLVTRFITLARFVGRLGLALRVTPLSFIGGLIVDKLASWAYSEYQVVQLKSQFQAIDEEAPLAGQELSLALNGLHILYLGEADARVRDLENILRRLAPTDLSDLQFKQTFTDWAIANEYVKFADFRSAPTQQATQTLLNSMRRRYVDFIKQNLGFSTFLKTMEAGTNVKRGLLERRSATLLKQQAEARAKFASFPAGPMQDRLMRLFKRGFPRET